MDDFFTVPSYNIVVPDIPFKWNYDTIGMELWIGLGKLNPVLTIKKRGERMDDRMQIFIKEKFGLTPEDILKMGATELDQLYDKAMALEEILAVESQDEITEELNLAADFVNYLHEL